MTMLWVVRVDLLVFVNGEVDAPRAVALEPLPRGVDVQALADTSKVPLIVRPVVSLVVEPARVFGSLRVVGLVVECLLGLMPGDSLDLPDGHELIVDLSVLSAPPAIRGQCPGVLELLALGL